MRVTKTMKIVSVGVTTLAVATAAGIGYAAWTHVTQAAPVTGTVGSNGDTLTLTTGNAAHNAAAALPTTPGTSTQVHVYGQNVTQASQHLTTLGAVLTATTCTVGDNTKDFSVSALTSPNLTVPANTAAQDLGYFTVTLNAASTDACQGDSTPSLAITGS
jgi:hypothetical protein